MTAFIWLCRHLFGHAVSRGENLFVVWVREVLVAGLRYKSLAVASAAAPPRSRELLMIRDARWRVSRIFVSLRLSLPPRCSVSDRT